MLMAKRSSTLLSTTRTYRLFFSSPFISATRCPSVVIRSEAWGQATRRGQRRSPLFRRDVPGNLIVYVLLYEFLVFRRNPDELESHTRLPCRPLSELLAVEELRFQGDRPALDDHGDRERCFCRRGLERAHVHALLRQHRAAFACIVVQRRVIHAQRDARLNANALPRLRLDRSLDDPVQFIGLDRLREKIGGSRLKAPLLGDHEEAAG